MTISAALTLLVAALSLSGPAVAQEVIHPTKENIPTASEPRFELRHQEDGDDLWSWEGFDVVTIGKEEGQAHEMIGMVWDLDVDHNGRLFYLDPFADNLWVYDYDGHWIGNVGSPGPGPGEFDQPSSLAVFDEGRKIMVTDLSYEHTFRREGTRYHLESANRAEQRGDRICVMNGHYYTVQYNPEAAGVIHKLTLDGEWVASFGAPYQYDSGFIVAMMTMDSFIACNEHNRTVAHVVNHIPAMTVYSETGEQLWQVTFPDYRSDTVEEGLSNGRQYHAVLQEDNTSVFQALFADGDYFYVTYVFRKKAMHPRPKSVHISSHAFKVHARTGDGTYLGSAGPETGEVLMAVDGPVRVTTSDNDGYPQIKIYKPK